MSPRPFLPLCRNLAFSLDLIQLHQPKHDSPDSPDKVTAKDNEDGLGIFWTVSQVMDGRHAGVQRRICTCKTMGYVFPSASGS